MHVACSFAFKCTRTTVPLWRSKDKLQSGPLLLPCLRQSLFVVRCCYTCQTSWSSRIFLCRPPIFPQGALGPQMMHATASSVIWVLGIWTQARTLVSQAFYSLSFHPTQIFSLILTHQFPFSGNHCRLCTLPEMLNRKCRTVDRYWVHFEGERFTAFNGFSKRFMISKKLRAKQKSGALPQSVGSAELHPACGGWIRMAPILLGSGGACLYFLVCVHAWRAHIFVS